MSVLETVQQVEEALSNPEVQVQGHPLSPTMITPQEVQNAIGRAAVRAISFLEKVVRDSQEDTRVRIEAARTILRDGGSYIRSLSSGETDSLLY